MDLKLPDPPETVTLPGAPESLRLKRDKAIAALVIKNNVTIAQAAQTLTGALQSALDAAGSALAAKGL